MIQARPAMMVPEGFVVAMRGGFSRAPYGTPFRHGQAQATWLIVCRWGMEGEYLSIAQAEGPDQPLPPLGLRPQATFFGLRLAEARVQMGEGQMGEGQMGEGQMGEGPSFLLVRHLPPGVTVAGVFHPTDGIARLTGPAGALRLEAAGRYAHLRGESQQAEVRADVPDPPEGAPEAMAWSLGARRLPWLGEFLASGSIGG
ncbi:MAG: hypothetical protein JWP04_1823 [Belnapia sp.]|nr:hypothetical protein [Belnapia sp.]